MQTDWEYCRGFSLPRTQTEEQTRRFAKWERPRTLAARGQLAYGKPGRSWQLPRSQGTMAGAFDTIPGLELKLAGLKPVEKPTPVELSLCGTTSSLKIV